jgi:predicted MPP superfamily phosphohydrolase
MTLFLITFLLVYSGLHLYVFLKIRAAFSLGIQANIILVLFMALMILSPIIVRLAEQYDFELIARVLAYIGFTWMGILVLFIASSLVIDFYRFILCAAGFIAKKDFSRFMVPHIYAFFIPFVLATIATVYGYFEARDIRTETEIIKTEKIPQSIGRLKIVQISDVHLGLIMGKERLKEILHIVKTEDPDILVSTGDLVDGQGDDIEIIAELLKEIKPRYGKFAITGNHEFYAGLAHSLEFMKESGFTVLRGERVSVDGILHVVGVDDPAGRQYNLYNSVSEKELLTGLPRDTFTLMLKHRPVIDGGVTGLFDLQLSGHVHKGQIFPLSIITGILYPIQEGLAYLSGNSYLYVSRGTGTWGPPIRVFAPPEVTVIELVHPQDFT